MVLARVLHQDADQIFDRLSPLVDRRLIAFQTWTTGGATGQICVAFDPSDSPGAPYSRLCQESRSERRRRPPAVAEALQELIAEDDPPPSPRGPRDRAGSTRRRGEPVQAATRLVDVAESTFAEGADRETALHAGRALELLRGEGARTAAPRQSACSPERRYSSCSAARRAGAPTRGAGSACSSWQPRPSARPRLGRPAAPGRHTLCDRAVDPRLPRARGRRRGVPRIARPRREKADDAVAEFAILLRLGHQLDSVDLREGARCWRRRARCSRAAGWPSGSTPNALTLEQARLDSGAGRRVFDLGGTAKQGSS